jgi:hypothetical protein
MRKRATFGFTAGLLVLFSAASVLTAADLKPGATTGFARYVKLTEERMQRELRVGAAFLWIDGLAGQQNRDVAASLRRGDVVTEQLGTRDSARLIPTPGALIHHWVGIAFIPGASLDQVLRVVQDYEHHQQFYGPQVMKSKLLERSGDDFKVYLRLKQVKVITVILDTEHEVHYVRLDATRAYSVAYATRIVEIEHADEKNERALPTGKDHGFLWRLNTYWRFSETGGGVYVQCEAISLTRDIPVGLDALVAPFLESIPRESLIFTLRSTRVAVLGRSARALTPDLHAAAMPRGTLRRRRIQILNLEASHVDQRSLLEAGLVP